jgi:general secretion pathway protein K
LNFPRPNGAEAADYRAAGMEWGPKNAPFEEITELQQVLGMTMPIYKEVAPLLTVYSTYPLGIVINPKLADEKLTESLRQGGLDSKLFINSSSTVYSIRAEAKAPNEAVFVREAVVQTFPGSAASVRFLAWRQGT